MAEFEQKVGVLLASGLKRLADHRTQMLADNPNRFLLLRVQNPNNLDFSDSIAALDVAGPVYDLTWNGQREERSKYSPFKGKVELPRIPANFDAELRLWYRYQELSARAFPGPKDYEWEQTQGLRIPNLTAANTVMQRDPSIPKDFSAYHRYDIDPVVTLRRPSI